MKKMLLPILIGILSLHVCKAEFTQEWTSQDGQSMYGTAVSHDWVTVLMRNKRKEVRIPLTRFSDEHKKQLLRLLESDLSWTESLDIRKKMVPELKAKITGPYDMWRVALHQTGGSEAKQAELLAKYEEWKDAIFKAKALGKSPPGPPVVLKPFRSY